METVTQAAARVSRFFETKNERMKCVMRDVASLAREGKWIVFAGPSGCGKELLARYYAGIYALHGGRKDQPFCSISCASLTDANSHDLLFGRSKDTSSGAGPAQRGFFEICSKGGVLFLDEIEAASPAVLPQLLLALDAARARPLYSEEDDRPGRIVVLAALECPLKELCRPLRERLGHRIRVPGIDERPEDVGPAVLNFVERAVAGRKDLEDGPAQLDALLHAAREKLVPALAERARDCSWPGNFRSLRREVEFAVCTTPLSGPEPFVAQVLETFSLRLRSRKALRAVGSVAAPSWPQAPQALALLRRRFPKSGSVGHTELVDFITRRGEEGFFRRDLDAALGWSENTSRGRLKVLVEGGLLEEFGSGLFHQKPPPLAPVRAAPVPFEALRPPLCDSGQLKELLDLLRGASSVFLSVPDEAARYACLLSLAQHFSPERQVLFWSLRAGGLEALLTAVAAELRHQAPALAVASTVSSAPGLAAQVEQLGKALAQFFAGRDKPLLIVHEADALQDPAEQEALRVLLRCWSFCQVLLAGKKLPVFLAEMGTGAPLEHTIGGAEGAA